MNIERLRQLAPEIEWQPRTRKMLNGQAFEVVARPDGQLVKFQCGSQESTPEEVFVKAVRQQVQECVNARIQG